MKGKPGEYSCLLCNQPLESFSGETLIAYRLDIERSTTLKRSRAKPGLSGQDRVNSEIARRTKTDRETVANTRSQMFISAEVPKNEHKPSERAADVARTNPSLSTREVARQQPHSTKPKSAE